MVTSVSSTISNWANTLFSRLDTSNKGYVSQTDLESAFSQIASSSSSTAATSTTSSADSLFKALDTNGDSKVTQDELATGLQKLADQMSSQFSDQRLHQAVQGAQGGMPPPPPPRGDGDGDADDAGLTQAQMTTMASNVADSDSNLASQLNTVLANFDKADTNGDGKVSFAETQAYLQSTASSTSGITSSTGTTGTSTASTGKLAQSGQTQSGGLSDAELFRQVLQLLGSYGALSAGTSSAGSTLSISA